MLHIENVSKSYPSATGPVEVLRGVSLSLNVGESLALTGESGCGKSTLLHLIGGLDEVDAGIIRIDGQALTDLNEAARAALRRDRIGIVFQQFNLIPSLKVAANIAFQARLGDQYDADWIETLANQLGLSDLMHRYPEDLSGGQQQRVAIARALAMRPSLILADEPTGNLDETTSEAVVSVMLTLASEAGATLLMVTHSLALADRLQRQHRLHKGQIVP